MRYKVLSVRDRAIDAYGQPFFTSSVGGAIRSFADEINRAGDNNPLSRHPEDYDLYLLGEFDDSLGEFSCERPSQVAVGKDLVR